jgi:cytochrome c oxidase subunit 1
MAVTETSTDAAPAPVEPEEPPAAAPAPSIGSGAAGNDHKALGSAFVGVGLVFLLVGGVLALLMRAQLTAADADFANPRQYRQLFTYHGAVSVFLFLLPTWIGLATAIVPLQIGASRLAFPRLQTLALWLTIFGGGLVVASPFVDGGKRVLSGWALNSPIPQGRGYRGDGVEYLLLGLALVLAAAILATANLLTTLVKLRAEGLTPRRLPLFSWSVLVGGTVFLLALPVLMAAFVMMFVDHHYGGRLFRGLTSDRGGNSLLWPRLFWFGAYPMLWGLVILALGTASEIVAVFAGRRIADRKRALGALVAVGILAFAGWGSEVRNLTAARPLFIVGALAVLAPVVSLLLNWLLTLRPSVTQEQPVAIQSRLLSTPMLMVLGLVSVLAVGLAAGAFSAYRSNTRWHDNYWAVGQQHLLYFMPPTLAAAAALHYWGPKLWGRHLSGALGKLEALLLVGGAHLAFIPALILGVQDMPVHTSTYTSNDNLELANLAVSAGTAIIALGAVVLVLDLLVSIVLRRGRPASADPWEGHTLEWATSSPPPRHNFERLPEIRSEAPVLDLRTAGVVR